VDFGCGVGRVALHLALRFDKVIAVDISEGNLRQCADMAARRGLANIECLLLRSPDDLSHLPEVDFVYSVIALQHNTPPIQKLLLDMLLAKIRDGGGFLFQTQTFYHDDVFDIEKYLKSPVDVMDVHSLPMHEILRLIEHHGLSLREVASDHWTGRHGSHTFFGVARPDRAGAALFAKDQAREDQAKVRCPPPIVACDRSTVPTILTSSAPAVPLAVGLVPESSI
jgi:SAM-dependent methyltransferase